MPASLLRQWSVRSYHGSVEHNSRAVINRYLGYWDGNLTTLIPLSTEDSAPIYVEMMGAASFDDQIKTGRAKLAGDRTAYEQLKTLLVHFDLGFEIRPGTGIKDLTPEQKPFEQEELGRTDGGK